VLVYVATPAIWTTGWRIPLPDDADLVAAAVSTPLPVATTSPRLGWRSTRALRWAVPPGSVYLLSFRGDAVKAQEWAVKVHGKQWGMAVGRDPANKLITAGFGVVLTGVWS
jgi:CRISPR-associated protein Cmr3